MFFPRHLFSKHGMFIVDIFQNLAVCPIPLTVMQTWVGCEVISVGLGIRLCSLLCVQLSERKSD